MKKIIKIIIGLFVLMVVALVVGVIYIDQIAEAGIERGSTFTLGVESELDEADIALLAGHSELEELLIANPSGYSSPHFLRLDEGELDVALPTLTKDTIEIPKIWLSGIDVNLEKKGGKANYEVIIDNLSRFESREKTEPATREQGRKYIIREIVVRNVAVHFDLLPIGGDLTQVTVPLEELRLADIGSDTGSGVIMAQVFDDLIKSILMAAMAKGGDRIPAEIMGDLQAQMAKLDDLKEIGDKLAGDFKRQVEELNFIDSGILDQPVGVLDSIAKPRNGSTGPTEESAAQAGESARQTIESSGEELRGTGDRLKDLGGGLLDRRENVNQN